MASVEYPVTVVVRECANGETHECFFAVDGAPIYGPAGCGAFLTNPTEREAFDGAMRVAEGRLAIA